MKKLFFIIITALFLSACNSGVSLLPGVSGSAGEVLLVAGSEYLDGPLVTCLHEVLSKEYFILPQSEPMFDVRKIGWPVYSKIFESHRNQIKIYISAEYEEAKLIVHNDEYASPQIIINIAAPNEESAIALVEEKQETIIELLEQAERNRTLANATKYPETTTYAEVKNLFGGSLTFPSGFRTTNIKNENFVWVVQNIRKAMLGILVFSYPYVDGENFELEQLISTQNKILQANMPSSAEGSYMQIGTVIEPKLRFLRYNDILFGEMRGLWNVENGFMGGSFVSHSFLDKEEKNVIVTMAFVYAPNQDKRNYIRQAEAILFSWEWMKNKEE